MKWEQIYKIVKQFHFNVIRMLEIEIENDLIFLCVLRCPPPMK